MDNYNSYYVTYRGKSLKDQKWVYGDLIRVNAKTINRYHDRIYTEDCKMIDVDRFTISQSICLTDTNGQKIYVNDFVKVYFRTPWYEHVSDDIPKYKTLIGEIIVDRFKFRLKVIKEVGKESPDCLYYDIFDIPDYTQPRIFEVLSNREDDPLFESKVYAGKIS
jgi:uncharacterized phage protein (TIGR01671 family)